jgi:hypothetical protein
MTGQAGGITRSSASQWPIWRQVHVIQGFRAATAHDKWELRAADEGSRIVSLPRIAYRALTDAVAWMAPRLSARLFDGAASVFLARQRDVPAVERHLTSQTEHAFLIIMAPRCASLIPWCSGCS